MTVPFTDLANSWRSHSEPEHTGSRSSGIAVCAVPLFLFVLLLGTLVPHDVLRAADDAYGKQLYAYCKRCHQIGEGAEHRIGPHLNDLLDRTAGSLPDFRYSNAMKNAGENGLIWTTVTLDAFLAEPGKVVERSRMSFAGIPDAHDRAELIVWLTMFTSTNVNLPPAEPTYTLEEYDLDPAILEIEGDPAYGAYLAGQCTSCHHKGQGDQGIPSITGWPVNDFVIALHAYKHGKIDNPAMQLIARNLSNEEIAALAIHYSNTHE